MSQIFLNLLIAVIIDSFFGSTDAANLPVNERAIEAYPDIWSKYDPEKTGFILCSQLESLFIDMSQDADCRELLIFPDKVADEVKDGQVVIDHSSFRHRIIQNLDIPTYDNFTRVMFYDVLQQLCNQIVSYYHNKK